MSRVVALRELGLVANHILNWIDHRLTVVMCLITAHDARAVPGAGRVCVCVRAGAAPAASFAAAANATRTILGKVGLIEALLTNPKRIPSHFALGPKRLPMPLNGLQSLPLINFS